MEERIPRRIIQTGKSADLPLKERAVSSNLRLLNPDFEYLFFDDEQVEAFIDEEFPELRPIVESFPQRIQRYDLFRYLAIYHYGGFYFDLDVMLAHELASVLECACVFPFEGLTLSRYLRDVHGMDWHIGNYAFGASKGHPFIKAIIDNCVRAQREPAWVNTMMKGVPPLSHTEFAVLNSTGPGLISRTLAEERELAAAVTVLFPEDVCDSSKWNRFGDLGVHMMDGSWRLASGFLRRRVAQRWELWQLQRVLAESRGLGALRDHPGNRKQS